jgi:hypothetical protein
MTRGFHAARPLVLLVLLALGAGPAAAHREQTLASLERIGRVLPEQNAQLWINHDKAQSDGLRYAPAYDE